MTLVSQARELLSLNDYHVSWDKTAENLLLFENPSVFGFLATYKDATTLGANWSETHDDFLTRHSRALRLHQEKAWNAYAVFLSEGAIDEDAVDELSAIEEDFHATRKIARAGIETSEDLRRALSPLLPIRHAPVLDAVDLDQRLATFMPAPVLKAFAEMALPSTIADLLELDVET